MVRPRLRDPASFNDLLLILGGYIFIMWAAFELTDSDIVRDIFLIGAIVVFGWAMWAMYAFLDIEEEDQDE